MSPFSIRLVFLSPSALGGDTRSKNNITMRKFIHTSNKTHQSQSRFACNGSSQSVLTTTNRTHSPNSKMTLMSRINNPYESFPSPSPITDTDLFKTNLKNCLEMCSAYIQALNSLCSTGTSLAESLGQVFGHNINLTNVTFPHNSQSLHKSSKKCPSETDQNTPSYADVLTSGNLDTKIYYDMAKQFFTVWHHLSNATAGASATIKTETLIALQDLINKIESQSVSDNNHHLHSVHQNGPSNDQNDPSGTLIDSIQSAKSCLLSYIELQTQFSYSSWKSLNYLSKALKADNSMKDVVKRLKIEFDLQKQISSSPIKQNASVTYDDHVNNCPGSSFFGQVTGDRVIETSHQSKHSADASSKKKREKADLTKTPYEEAFELLSIKPGKNNEERKHRSSTKKSSKKRSTKATSHLHRSIQQTTSHQTQQFASNSSGAGQSSQPRNSRKQPTNRRKNSPDNVEAYKKSIEAYNAKQHRNDSSRQAMKQESSINLTHINENSNSHSQTEVYPRLKSMSTSTWPGKGPNIFQPTEPIQNQLVSPTTENYRPNLHEYWSLWPSNQTPSWNLFDAIGSNGSPNADSTSATPSFGFDPFGGQCSSSGIKSSRQTFKSPSNNSARSSVLPGSSINVLNNNLSTLGDPSSIGSNRFPSLEDYIDLNASSAFSTERIPRFDTSNHPPSPRLVSDSAGIASVLNSDLTVPHQTPNPCTSSTSLTIDPLRMAKTSTWPLKQSPINSTLTNAVAGSSALLHSDGINDNGNPGPPWLSHEQQLISYGLPSEDSHLSPCAQTNNLWLFNGPKGHSTSNSSSSQVTQSSLHNGSNGRYSLFENNNNCRSIEDHY